MDPGMGELLWYAMLGIGAVLVGLAAISGAIVGGCFALWWARRKSRRDREGR